MQIEMMPVDRLIPYIRNSRTHSADQVAQIAVSIVEFGFTNPLLTGEDGVIIAGQGMLRAGLQIAQVIAETFGLQLDHQDDVVRGVDIRQRGQVARHLIAKNEPEPPGHVRPAPEGPRFAAFRQRSEQWITRSQSRAHFRAT